MPVPRVTALTIRRTATLFFPASAPSVSAPTNAPPKPSCAACRARTRWDNQADYDNFLAHMKDTSRVYMLQGAAEVGAALMCLLAPFAFLLISGHPSFTGLFILGFFMLSVQGI